MSLAESECQFSQSQFWFTPDFSMGVHHYRYARNQFDCLPHTHGDYHILICLSGAMEFVRKTSRVRLQAGEVHALNPGEVHCSQMGLMDSVSEGITLVLSKVALTSVLRKVHLVHGSAPDNLVFLGKSFDRNLLNLARGLLHEIKGRRMGYEVVVQSLLLQILVYLLRHCLELSVRQNPLELPPQLPSWQINRAFEYMNCHKKSTFSLPELCSEVGSSPSRFISLFRNSTRLTPSLFYNKLMMIKAQMLLQTAGASTKEVAGELGFKKASHFCALFHKICGMTPTAYQRLEKNASINVFGTSVQY
jgi:AraC-like DNA-binding protein